jgi:deazaflavin-dependent oxidoreductase (nitroreductase family)
MPLPRSLAEFNKRYTNRVTRRFAAVLPGFGILTHRGRKSGRAYSIPVNVFRRSGGWVFALTYGQGDWVRNVLAAGGADLHTRGEDHHVTNPRVVRDALRSPVPRFVRTVLKLIDADEFLYVDEPDRR